MSKNEDYNPVMTAIIVVFVICLIGAVIGTVADTAKHGGPPEWGYEWSEGMNDDGTYKND